MIGYILVFFLWLLLIAFVLNVTLSSIGLGLFIGIFPGVFHAVKNYCSSVKEKITNPFVKAVSYISVGIGVGVPILFVVTIIVAGIVTLITYR